MCILVLTLSVTYNEMQNFSNVIREEELVEGLLYETSN